jgi:hypothetical protein
MISVAWTFYIIWFYSETAAVEKLVLLPVSGKGEFGLKH